MAFRFDKGALRADVRAVRDGCLHLARCPVFALLVQWALVDPNLKAWSQSPGAMVRDGRFGRDIGNFCYSIMFFVLRTQAGFMDAAQQIEQKWPSVTGVHPDNYTGWERLGDVLEYALGVWNDAPHGTCALRDFSVEEHRLFSSRINSALLAVQRLNNAHWKAFATPQEFASALAASEAFIK